MSTVELDGFSGNITITATPAATSIDTGLPGNTHYVMDAFDAATHTLRLFCANNATCPATTYTVTIPAHVGLILHQVSGQARLADLSGPVSITATSADTTATGLAAASFSAVITSGRLDAAFADPPGRVSVSVVSAEATVHLPGSAQYAVAQQVQSGNVQVQVPQDPNSPDTVDATVTSGQINLVTS